MRKILFLLLALVLSASSVMAQGNTVNESFSKAKKALREIYAGHRLSVYCAAPFVEHLNVIAPEGFDPGKFTKRAAKIEWEHAVPAENFGQAFPEWRTGLPQCEDNRGKRFKGRKCAEKMNKTYRRMQSDMHNLFPAIGSVNAARSNYRYAELPKELASSFGSCPAKIEDKRFEPPDRAKGIVARASMYMDDSYPLFRLSDQQKKLFLAWDSMYPPDEWECERNLKIMRIQGNDNPFVTRRCR